MSRKSWTEEGYGFALNGNTAKIAEFLIANGDYDEDTQEEMRECEDFIELEEYIEDPIPWAIANIINKIEGAELVKGYRSCGDTNQEEMLGIEPLYPWQMEKPLTKDEADALLKKYAGLLGITQEPDYFTAEYFG